jgi:hypothetical protein
MKLIIVKYLHKYLHSKPAPIKTLRHFVGSVATTFFINKKKRRRIERIGNEKWREKKDGIFYFLHFLQSGYNPVPDRDWSVGTCVGTCVGTLL